MSTLNVSNITDGTTTVGTSYVVNGSAKAWVQFNGTGTVAIDDSFSVTSITDFGTANYGVNFTASMANANYAAMCAAGGISGSFCTSLSVANYLAVPTSSNVRVVSYYGTGASDCSQCNVSIQGDLA